MKRTIIVDENDNEIGIKSDKEVTFDDIYRVSSLWVLNQKKQVLLVKRALAKTHDPGKWAPAVAGTVEEGETYESNIVKEIKEEIGLDVKIEDLIKGPKILSKYKWTHFGQMFLYILPAGKEKSLVYDEREICDHRWFEFDEIEAMLKTDPTVFVGSFEKNYKVRADWIKSVIN